MNDIATFLNGKDHKENHKPMKVLDPLGTVLTCTYEKFRYHLGQSQEAQDYLQQKRGLSNATIEKFGIGYAPHGLRRLLKQSEATRWQILLQKAMRQKLTFEQARDQLVAIMDLCGLIATKDDGEQIDRFYDRIMVPIKDENGSIISFGGRIFNTEMPAKYINGSDSPLFNKKDVLFNLDTVRINYLAKQKSLISKTQLEKVVVVEGYMDVIGMSEFGIYNTVAGMGTAMSSAQLNTLFKYTDNLILCYDGDSAGCKAARRAAEEALITLKGNRQISIVTLPENHDPDSYLKAVEQNYDKASARDSLEELFEQGIPISEYLVKSIADENNLTWSNSNELAALIVEKINKIDESSIVRNELQTLLSLGTQEQRNYDHLNNEQMVEFAMNFHPGK